MSQMLISFQKLCGWSELVGGPDPEASWALISVVLMQYADVRFLRP
jgi:hypothetical protein